MREKYQKQLVDFYHTLLVSSGIALWVLVAGAAFAGDPPELEYLRFTPVAIFGDGEDEMNIEVRVTGSVASVRARDPLGRLRLDGVELGINGEFDLNLIGPEVWGRSGLSSTRNDDFGSLVIVVEEDGGSEFPLESFAATFYIVEPRHRRDIISLTADAQMTDHLLNLNATTSDLLEVGSSTDTTSAGIHEISQAFYEHLPDAFDYLSIFIGVTMPSGYFHLPASNSVSGIGVSLFDNTATFGSDGRLRGVNYLGLSGGGPLLHETTHSVAAFLDSSLGLDNGSPHWGAVDIPGFVFGLEFEEQNSGDYLITWSRFGGLESGDSLNRRFPPMELYLWGLAEATDVPDITVLEGVNSDSVRAGDVVTPTAVSTITMANVVNQHGLRSPSYGQAPTTFHMAGVLVTPQRLASDAEMALWSRVMEHFGSEEASTLLPWGSFGSSFHFATDGRGRMVTELNQLFHDRFQSLD